MVMLIVPPVGASVADSWVPSPVHPDKSTGQLVIEKLPVAVDHDRDELVEADGGLPTKDVIGLGWIADQAIDLAGSVVARVNANVVAPVAAGMREGGDAELLDAVGFTGGDDEVLGRVVLE